MRLSIAILFSLLLLAGCLENAKHTNTINRNGYSISYGSDLRLDETGQHGAEFSLSIPTEAVTGGFAENLNLVIQNLANMDIDLNKFVEISENQVKDSNGILVESKRCKINGKDAHKLISEGQYNDFELKYMQYYLIENEKAYVLTYMAKKSHFDKYLDRMEAVMNSFRIL